MKNKTFTRENLELLAKSSGGDLKLYKEIGVGGEEEAVISFEANGNKTELCFGHGIYDYQTETMSYIEDEWICDWVTINGEVVIKPTKLCI